jgi:hypothetical protein
MRFLPLNLPQLMTAGMWCWFNDTVAEKRIDAVKNMILEIQSQRNVLKERERHLQKRIKEYNAVARKSICVNRNGT